MLAFMLSRIAIYSVGQALHRIVDTVDRLGQSTFGRKVLSGIKLVRFERPAQLILCQLGAAIDRANQKAGILFELIDCRVALAQLGQHPAYDVPTSQQRNRSCTRHPDQNLPRHGAGHQFASPSDLLTLNW
ncbi:hypothetical protein ASE94_00135 [Devosia sp. Leaf64]|nr:hypothetical protein ASE94_00135 [Devosia sp. Leaf64]